MSELRIQPANVAAELREWSILSRRRREWFVSFSLARIWNKDSAFNILFLDVSLIAPWPCPSGRKWRKEWEIVKYTDDQREEIKVRKKGLCAVYHAPLQSHFWSARALLEAFRSGVFVLSLGRLVSLRWLKNLANTCGWALSASLSPAFGGWVILPFQICLQSWLFLCISLTLIFHESNLDSS